MATSDIKRSKTAGIGDAAVKKATGKDWAAWFRLLDRRGARRMTHKEIAAMLHKSEGLSGWWSQMVTVGYEQATGVRRPGEKPGGFDISRSKTVGTSTTRAFNAWKSAAERKAWLGDEPVTIRTATAGKSMRLSWSDGKTTLSVNFYPKDARKCQVVVQHMKLPSAAAGERMKKFWAAALERLADHLAV
jgi:hypothetical protein